MERVKTFNILTLFLYWYFVYLPKEIISRIKNLWRFGIYFFSADIALKTFFSHWRRLSDYYPKGLEIQLWIETFLGNLISRSIGIIMRSILLMMFIFYEFLVTFTGLLILIFWLGVFPLTIYILYYAVFAG